MRDFTFRMYQRLCNALLEGHSLVGVRSYLKNSPGNAAIIRHDVDKKPENALVMARIEQELGINSTYYFRTVPSSFNKKIILQIHDMGHEIGYHYEVLDKSKGDYSKAIDLFEHEMELFPCKIETICMHGNPLTAWVNRDLWLHYDYKKFGIIGEAYLSFDFSTIEYYSDTGRTWSDRYSVKDLTNEAESERKALTNTQSLLDHIEKSSDCVCVVTHPQRWNDDCIPWLRELFSQSIKNIGKSGIKYLKAKG
jgi:hypothetical protein